ncbi:MAG: ArsA-related P-loop ATPase [Bdellovibrionales bacterium]
MKSVNEAQNIVMVTGKGGVGKSAIAAAIAQKHAHSGQNTLLVELGDQSYFTHIYHRKIDYHPVEIFKNFSVALWNGESCLREYVRYLIKFEKVADLFFDNRVMHTLIRAAPALKELAILGKITSGIRKWGPSLNYDVIVVDGFASGNFMALLRAPIGMGELIKSGPMGEQSRNIIGVLKNPEQCKFVLVSLLEELSVTETIELKNDISKLLGQSSNVYCNRYYDCGLSISELESAASEASALDNQQFANDLKSKMGRQNAQHKILDDDSGVEKKVNLIFSADGVEIINAAEANL